MFKLDQGNTYFFPVTVEMTDAEGRKRKFEFDAEFERLPQDEINEFFRKREEGEAPLKDADLLDRVFKGWRKVQDAEGRELEVTPDNRAMLLNVYPVSPSIAKAWLKSIGIEGKAKN